MLSILDTMVIRNYLLLYLLTETYERSPYNPKDLKSAIERAIRKVHELSDQPDKVSPYTSVLSPRYSKDPVDSLLGRIEVEWESKEFEVTEEMVETVEKGEEFRYQLN
ncbi:hypothetical protein HMPREF9374_2736 [Desmospora sp. 8437]|nr:hypothetical protein HMPREF9374_2736 [Desmospora sp. 8437]